MSGFIIFIVVMLFILPAIGRKRVQNGQQQQQNRQPGDPQRTQNPQRSGNFTPARPMRQGTFTPAPAKPRPADEDDGDINTPPGFTPQEWLSYLAAHANGASSAPAKKEKPAPVRMSAPISDMSASTEGYHAMGTALYSDTEGESDEEHAAHIEAIRSEEMADHAAWEELLRSRDEKRAQLRRAVIMSEVLGKPVSLRARRH